MDSQLLTQALKGVEHGHKFAFATVVESTVKGTPRKAGAKMIVFEDGTSFGTIGGGRNEKNAQQKCLDSIQSGKTQLLTYDYFGQKGQSICGGQMRVFIEPFIQQCKLIICGAGHIALPLSILAKMLDFNVTIIDNRRAYANKKRFAHVDQIRVGKHQDLLKKCKIDTNTSIMIVTQGNEYDYSCLKSVIKSQAGYIGVISSKAKRIKFFKRLREAGISQKYLKRIHIPAGSDIGAQKPSEIAISIAAELVQTINKENLDTDKFLEKIKNQN